MRRSRGAISSWDADEQRAFRRLGCLPGRFPSKRPQRFSLRWSGLRRHGRRPHSRRGPDRQKPPAASRASSHAHPLYQMLETVRAYATVALTAVEERESAMEGLVRHCTMRPRTLRTAWSDPRRRTGWTGCVTTSITIAVRLPGSSNVSTGGGCGHHMGDVAVLVYARVRRRRPCLVREDLNLSSLSPATDRERLSARL
jgi:hypothetical protein